MKAKNSILLLLISLQFLSLSGQENCEDQPPEDTFEVVLPAINSGITEVGFPVSPIWNDVTPVNDVIHIPNGRPIYALIVSGYASNQYLDEMMLYNFARDLMDKGAYVHYSWWNNLLAPYMERPLHNSLSHPGSLVSNGLNFTTLNGAENKALPGEDYQFVADAKILLQKIRENNPNAIIIVAGHSMGGGAVVHLGSETNELIDILAPIDPVGNRNLPWAGLESAANSDYNWTRWRVSRDHFLGYKDTQNVGTVLNPVCGVTGPWLPEPPVGALICGFQYAVHQAPTLTFGSNIINLHHRYQQEALFPFDYTDSYPFGHSMPLGGSSTQMAVPMQSGGSDPGGWPQLNPFETYACCYTGEGVGWPDDGHGEIVGYRGPDLTVPIGVRLQTSPNCGSNCSGLNWPARTYSGGWQNGNGTLRKQKLIALETFPLGLPWADRPYNPGLCKVSQGLIDLYPVINKPPTAVAGDDQLVECDGQGGASVTLDGSQSTDPESDDLTYTWTSDFGIVSGETVDLTLPLGQHCIKLTVTDLVGHIDIDWLIVDVVDTTGPELSVSLSPNHLWPPNHRMRNIQANVEAMDLCGSVESIVLYSIESSEAFDVIGSGQTTPDISDAEYNTYDVSFKLRAERSGRNRVRVYTVYYKATDDSGNFTITSAEVVVQNPSHQNSMNRSGSEALAPPKNTLEMYAYPNPFRLSATVSYHLPESDYVTLVVYDFLGKEIEVLHDGYEESGVNSAVFNGTGHSSGIYFCRITTSTESFVCRMVLK